MIVPRHGLIRNFECEISYLSRPPTPPPPSTHCRSLLHGIGMELSTGTATHPTTTTTLPTLPVLGVPAAWGVHGACPTVALHE